MKIFKFFAILCVFSIILWADWSYKYTTLGQWEIVETNWGAIGGWSWLSGYWPRGTGHNYIYGAGIWVGGILPNSDTVVIKGYHSGGTEYSPGFPYSDPLDPEWQVYFSTDFDYPFSPISLEDGYAIYNDFDTTFHMVDSFHVPEPLGITITQKSFVWSKDWADDVVFIQYIIKNDTTYTINNLYAGFFMDFDIGNEAGGSANDRCGLDLPRKLFYGWQDTPEAFWDWRGMLGLKLLSPCSLSCFKRFYYGFEPLWDRECYQVMAGYNFNTGFYEPYDTIWPEPDDQRIIMSSGPLESFAPGDSIVLDWALIGSRDTVPPCSELLYKADKAQSYYNTGIHDVEVIYPNNGEVISGLYSIEYTTNSITGNPLLIDIYFNSENYSDTVALGIEDYGGYDWLTNSVPDCVMGKLTVLAYDTITFGFDISDGYFSIDNPGNGPPEIVIISPADSETIAGEYDITWFARDPEFYDSLFINIYFKSQYDTAFWVIASNEPNDSVYKWNTVPYRNGSGLLVLETQDEEFTVAETIQVYLLNQIPAGVMHHVNGVNNAVNVLLLQHQFEQFTGHTYELRFLEYHCLYEYDHYYPEYIYEIFDSNTGLTVLDTYSLASSYVFYNDRIGINDFSPIIDGFSIRSYTESDNIIARENFRNDSVKVFIGSYPEDSIVPYGAGSWIWWAYRGSRLQLDWINGTNGGVSLLVTDSDYGDTIPYKSYSYNDNPDSAFGWCFRWHRLLGTPSDTLRYNDEYIFLCGEQLQFNRSIPPPEIGDRWIIYPSEYSPPIKGNIYRFVPVSISENKNQILPISFQVYPVPFTKSLTVSYNLSQIQKVRIFIYDVLGRKVKTLKSCIEGSGKYKIFWNGLDDKQRKVSSGVYFCRFATGPLGEPIDYTDTKKFILIK